MLEGGRGVEENFPGKVAARDQRKNSLEEEGGREPITDIPRESRFDFKKVIVVEGGGRLV